MMNYGLYLSIERCYLLIKLIDIKLETYYSTTDLPIPRWVFVFLQFLVQINKLN